MLVIEDEYFQLKTSKLSESCKRRLESDRKLYKIQLKTIFSRQKFMTYNKLFFFLGVDETRVSHRRAADEEERDLRSSQRDSPSH